ncbi:hypothetical protein M003_03890 [Pseudomonas aeruginosa IGB83]|nr:hypothetical protein M003_03890 [Pseudomonas aeruginosa IGB83]
MDEQQQIDPRGLAGDRERHRRALRQQPAQPGPQQFDIDAGAPVHALRATPPMQQRSQRQAGVVVAGLARCDPPRACRQARRPA